MKTSSPRHLLRLLTCMLLLGLVAAPVSASTQTGPGRAASTVPSPAQRLQPARARGARALAVEGALTDDDVWGPGTISVTGDVLIPPGVTLVIAPDTTVEIETMDQANVGSDPDRIELIVQGTLQANGPITFTSHSPTPAGGDWVGIAFRAGSGGWLEEVTIEYGVIGVAIDGGSPEIRGNTIRHLRGDDGSAGAMGASGGPGEDGSPGEPGQPGGDAYGILVTGDAAPLIQENTVHDVVGGAGGSGGRGGSGGAGPEGQPGEAGGPGGDGGPGAAGGAGGVAIGISIGGGGTPQVLTNTVQGLEGGRGAGGGAGGTGGRGGDGIDDGTGRDAGDGGGGGAAGEGASGGLAAGIRILPGAGPEVAGNSLYDILGGTGGLGGYGGQGGGGGIGGSRPSKNGGYNGGTGGHGGSSTVGADGGDGGAAYGISVDAGDGALTLARNEVAGLTGGPGGAGGPGGRGGYGGSGGQGSDFSGFCWSTCYAGDGGDAGRGQPGSTGGEGGTGGQAAGIHVAATELSTPARDNTIRDVESGTCAAGGAGGHGGDGGRGGSGGDATSSTNTYAGDGGRGGSAGSGGDGAHASAAGPAVGILSDAAAYAAANNLIASAAAAPGGAGGRGGDGGDGGYGGSGGWPNGSDGFRGSGGSGGNGGNGGRGGDSVGLQPGGSASSQLANNTVIDIQDGGLGGGPGYPGYPGRFGGSSGSLGFAGPEGWGIGLWARSGVDLTFSNNVLVHTDDSSSSATYGVRVEDASVTLGHNTLWNHAVPYLGTSEPATDLQVDPRFVSTGEFPGMYRLAVDSPCIDAGDNAATLVTLDLDGLARQVDGNGDGEAVVDMGAYEYQAYTLTLDRVGEGDVDVAPALPSYNYLDQTVLTATAGIGWTFAGWSGDATATDETITVTITADTAVTATFDAISLSLDVGVIGEGDVTADPDRASYIHGDVVTLTATAEPGWTFAGWSGDATATDETITVTITADTAVTATFEAIPYTLAVDVAGEGDVTVVPDQTSYIYGDVVTLTAVAEPGWTFAGWSGDATATDETITVTITADTAVTATFRITMYQIYLPLAIRE